MEEPKQRRSDEIDHELQQVRKELKELQEQNSRRSAYLFIGALILILLLFLFFSCKYNNEDYHLKVISIIKLDSTQIVTVGNKFTYYTLWVPDTPEYYIGQKIYAHEPSR